MSENVFDVPDNSVSLQGFRDCVVLDVETTGFDAYDAENPDRILEIGAINLETNEKFHVYIDPEREVPEDAYAVHGISREDAIYAGDGQKFVDIAEDLIKFVSNKKIIIHNSAFDVGFLNAELERVNKPNFETFCSITDTLKLARIKYPGKSNTLDALAKRYGIDNNRDDVDGIHGALIDCYLLGKVYPLLIQEQKTLMIEAAKNRISEASKNLNVTYLEEIIDLPVLKASDEELREHQVMKSRIMKKSGGDCFCP